MQEIWRDIDGCEGYQISTFGRVLSFKRCPSGKLLKAHFFRKSTYLVVDLVTEGKSKIFSVHRLVAEAFIPNPENKPEVNHIDGCKANNHVENLEWCTRAENLAHAVQTGLLLSGDNHPDSKLTREQVLWCREMYAARDAEFGATALAKKLGVDRTTVQLAVHGKTYKTAGGKIHKAQSLSAKICDEVKRLYVFGSSEFGAYGLAKRFNVSKSTIQYILKTK